MPERAYLQYSSFPRYSSPKVKTSGLFDLMVKSLGKHPLTRRCTHELMIPDTFSCEVVSWEYFSTLARTLAYRIKQSGFRPDLVIAIGRGGYVPARVVCDFLLHDLLTSFKIEHWGMAAQEKPAVIVRFPLAVDIRDKTVLVIDDVTDTGKTLEAAITYLKGFNPREIRTAVLQYKTSSAFCPDYYASREHEWRWIIYPWAVHEDLTGFIQRVLSDASMDERGIITALAERYRLKVPISDIRDTLEDLCSSGKVSRTGNLYTILQAG
jgi:hypoxanthine phosphoribosyltransferase